MAFKYVDWSYISRTLLDFRHQSNQTKTLQKLQNNFNVSYFKLFPENLNEMEKVLEKHKLSVGQSIVSMNTPKENSQMLKENEENEWLNIKNINLNSYILIGNVIDPNQTLWCSEEIFFDNLYIGNKSQFHGKEIDGFKGTLSGKYYNGASVIFKRPKLKNFNIYVKIKTQLLAKQLAEAFSRLFLFIIISVCFFL